jgi:chaperone modulatory protein CbpM
MIPVHEFLLQAHVDRQRLDSWISEGWLIPQRQPELVFSEVDLARAELIRELKEDFGVNDPGVTLILHLLDQVHGLRRSMREVIQEIHHERKRHLGE